MRKAAVLLILATFGVASCSSDAAVVKGATSSPSGTTSPAAATTIGVPPTITVVGPTTTTAPTTTPPPPPTTTPSSGGLAKVTILCDGVRGNLTKQLIRAHGIAREAEPAQFAVGLKERWEVPAGRIAGENSNRLRIGIAFTTCLIAPWMTGCVTAPGNKAVRQSIRDRRTLDCHAHTRPNMTPRLVDHRPAQFTNRPIWA